MAIERSLGCLFFLFYCMITMGQEVAIAESLQRLEHVAPDAEGNVDVEEVLRVPHEFIENPLSINQSDLDDWLRLGLVTLVQAQSFLDYRAQFGPLVSLYELQAIPGWDLTLIERLLPYVQLSDRAGNAATWRERFHKGGYTIEQRWGAFFDLPLEQRTLTKNYLGSNAYAMLRLSYKFKELTQWGITLEKDAGERLWDKSKTAGFDFVSAHFSAQKIGAIRSFVVGDYTLQFGQGLLLWQGLAFNKSLQLTSVSRQGVPLRPYRSLGESLFYRGVALQFVHGFWSLLPFVSFRKLDAIIDSANAAGTGIQVRSIVMSGYHRTLSENMHRGKQMVLTGGSSLQYRSLGFQWGLQMVAQHYLRSMITSGEPYAMFKFQGNKHEAISVDYTKMVGPFHFFGEYARSFPGGGAFVQGFLMQLDPKMGISLLYRDLSKKYLTIAGNAFTELSEPQGERGLFMGLSYVWSPYWQLDFYVDRFAFTWLRYQLPSPTSGGDIQLQVKHSPSKKTQSIFRVKYMSALKSIEESTNYMRTMVPATYLQFRSDLVWSIAPNVLLHGRMEWMWQRMNGSSWQESGFSAMGRISVIPKKFIKKIDVSISSYETLDGSIRLYHYEPDVGAGFGIRGFGGEGVRWVFLVKKTMAQLVRTKMTFDMACRVSQTIQGAAAYDVVAGRLKPISQGIECRLQASVLF